MAKTELKLGVIGMSSGNGHPYSWSAIFNGYNKQRMRSCPFPAIPEYLAQQDFPDAAIRGARVTHIWTQDEEISQDIAASAHIETVCKNPELMIGEIDALLLARDDAENHEKMSLPFLLAGIPVFIDKPLATDVDSAMRMFEFGDLVFSCSALRFANEFAPERLKELGEIRFIQATCPKSWQKYAVHIIEPTLNLLPKRGKPLNYYTTRSDELTHLCVEWENGPITTFVTTGDLPAPLAIQVFGSKGFKILKFNDSFSAFKRSLQYFIDLIQKKVGNINREFTLDVVRAIEKGMP